MSRTIWAHNILGYRVNGADAVWSNCGVCHSAISNVVAQSVHSGVGCKCHAVVHIGYNYSGTWLAGVYTYVGTGTGWETVPSIARTVRVYTQLNISATSALYALLSNVWRAAGPGRDVEVGLWDAYLKDYISTLPVGVGPQRVWAACFNCHFVNIDPSKVSDPHRIGWSFGVSPWDLNKDTGSIEPGAEPRKTSEVVMPPAGVLAALALLVGGLFYLRRRV
ncbi:hypothetical protein [Pyrobaculum ferrireducens]|uniref:hypothetical protein n=1 Tax=Pyrobaculum ferrireducens TaxID=1104324 RepID=UPI0011E54A89|nr:hypothetical protein [Pyrobaculum ferrireducens]